MGRLLIGKWGFAVVQASLAIYLLGDLAIYSTVVPKSLMQIVCQNHGNSCNTSGEMSGGEECVPFGAVGWHITRMDFYRIMVAAFVLLVGPFVFLGMTKTKLLQLFTTVTRWLAFISMLILASLRMAGGEGRSTTPPLAHAAGFSRLFGVATYAFMCHHSLPGLITPITAKSRLYTNLGLVYGLIAAFYAALALTGVFAFDHLQDVYTLNFLDPCKTETPQTAGDWARAIVDYFLALFPVFALSSNFPIVGITLKNNLLAIIALVRYVEEWAVAGAVLVIPAAVSLATDNVEELASITGGYAGALVQFVAPALLVIYARKRMVEEEPQLQSPFRNRVWPWLLLGWAVLTLTLITVNNILNHV